MLPRGEEELEEILVDRIAAHGGLCLFDDRAESLQLRGGMASGVTIDGDQGTIGAGFVIADSNGEDVASLAGGEGIHKRAQREWPRVTSSVGRFVVSLIVRSDGLPAPLGTECLILSGERPSLPRAGSTSVRLLQRPSVHLQRARRGRPGEELLVAELLLHDRGPPDLGDARQAVLNVLLEELPFLEDHLVVVDSVHDGLPVWVYEDRRRRYADRTLLKGAAQGAEPMVRKLEVDPPGYLGMGGEPIRGPISRSLLVGRSVLPGLGQEGQLLASWGAARLVTRSDRQKERMRRDMWSKIEIG